MRADAATYTAAERASLARKAIAGTKLYKRASRAGTLRGYARGAGINADHTAAFGKAGKVVLA